MSLRARRVRRAGIAASIAAVAAASALPSAAQPADGQPVYRLDPARSAVHFELVHFGASTIRGRFAGLTGEVALDRVARRGEVGLRIDTARVDSGIAVLDARLKRDDLLDVAAHPEAFFVARRFAFDGDRIAAVDGELTLRGASRPLSLRALRFSCLRETTAAHAMVERCGGDFEGELRRSDFGMTLALPLVADRVRLLVHAEGVRALSRDPAAHARP